MSTAVDLLSQHPRLSRQAQLSRGAWRILQYLRRHAGPDGTVPAFRVESWLPTYADELAELIDNEVLGLTADEAGYVLRSDVP